MTQDENSSYIRKPGVFSRASLQMTYDFLRHENAQLALQVRNILATEPYPKTSSEIDTKVSDHFCVDMELSQVRSVVEGMVAQENLVSDPGKVIMLKVLTQDWMALADKMHSELTDESES